MKDPEKFLRKVEKTDTCWIWKGSLFRLGYGRVRREDRIRSAHRVSYELFIGKIPEGLELDHTCRVRNCVNPEHLDPVTHLENMRRAFPVQPDQCPIGHAYDKRNTYINPKGRKVCRKCNNRQTREYRLGKRVRTIK